MLSFSGSLKIMLALEPCDMRKGYNGLYGWVAEKLQEDPRSGTLFVFSNKGHTRLKILYWDGYGTLVIMRRRGVCVGFSKGTAQPIAIVGSHNFSGTMVEACSGLAVRV